MLSVRRALGQPPSILEDELPQFNLDIARFTDSATGRVLSSSSEEWIENFFAQYGEKKLCDLEGGEEQDQEGWMHLVCERNNTMKKTWYMPVKIFPGTGSFEIGVHTTSRPAANWSANWSEDSELRRLQILAGFGSTWTPVAGPSGSCRQYSPGDIIVDEHAAHGLLCFPADDREHWERLTFQAASSNRVDIRLGVRVRWREEAVMKNHTVHLGGVKRPAATLTSFYLNESVTPKEHGFRRSDVQHKLHFKAERNELNKRSVGDSSTHVFVFPADNECVKGYIGWRGCADPDAVLSCLKGTSVGFAPMDSHHRLSHHVSFNTEVDITLTSETVPMLKPGRWLLLTTCEGHTKSMNASCPDTIVTMEFEPVYGTEWWLAMSGLILFVGTWIILLTVDYAVANLYRLMDCVCGERTERYNDSYKEMWPAFIGCPGRSFRNFIWDRSLGFASPRPFLAPILCLCIALFAATAAQFVAANYLVMKETGDHDLCFYNTRCYAPGFGFDLPVNHVIVSHIPYFVAGMHVILQACFAESRAQSQSKKNPEIGSLDMRPFFALGVTFFGEGLGSAFYHVCPTLQTFQFDTSFMIPIAHVAMTCLEDWHDYLADESTVLKYFLYILSPIWIFNFIGTWYDIRVGFGGLVYHVFQVAVIVWSLFATQCLDRFFADTRMGSCVRMTLKGLIIVVLAVVVLFRDVRDAIGGMANTFLLLSCVAMAAVVARQIVVLELEFKRCGIREFGEVLLKYSNGVFMVLIGMFALQFFNDKVVNVVPGESPASSHDYNQECVLFFILDKHDTWHFLSAIAIALFASLLVDVKVHAFARGECITKARTWLRDLELEDELEDSEDYEPVSEGDSEA